MIINDCCLGSTNTNRIAYETQCTGCELYRQIPTTNGKDAHKCTYGLSFDQIDFIEEGIKGTNQILLKKGIDNLVEKYKLH